jgi:hypothetical protein
LSKGSDHSGATGGGAPNLGSGGKNGPEVSQSGYAAGSRSAAPTKPSEWGSNVSNTFQGGFAVQHSSGSAGGAGNGYLGAGGGGSASERGVGNSGNGGSGAIFVTYYEINT